MITQKDLDRVKRAVLRKYEIAAGVALSEIDIRLSEEIDTACVVGEKDKDGVLQVKEILVNPHFFKNLTFAERVFVLAHEAFHIALRHFSRAMDMPEKDAERKYQEYCQRESDPQKRELMKAKIYSRYHELWNIATDACINAFLRRDGLSFPENVVDPRTGRKMTFVDMEEGLSKSAEKIYRYLVQKDEEKEKEKEDQKSSQSQDQKGNQSGQSGDQNGSPQDGGQSGQSGDQNDNPQDGNQSGQSGEQNGSPQDGGQSGQSGDQSDSPQDSNQAGQAGGQGSSSENGNPSSSASDSSSMGEGMESNSPSQGQQSSRGKQRSKSGSHSSGGTSIDDVLSGDYTGLDSHEEWNGSSKDRSKSPNDSDSSKSEGDESTNSESNSSTSNGEGRTSSENDSSRSDGEGSTSSDGKEGSETSEAGDSDNIDEEAIFDKIIRSREGATPQGTPVKKALSKIRSDAGIIDPTEAKAIIPWQTLLVGYLENYEEQWGHRRSSRYNPNPRMEERMIESRPEVEVILDTSGSISTTLLKGFLLQLVPIFQSIYGEEVSIKVGFFGDGFSGFTTVRSIDDIKKLHPSNGGGTNFEVAATSFTPDPGRRITKIVFTDGVLGYPQRTKVENLVWIVFGNGMDFEPVSGRIIRVSSKDYDSMVSSGQCLVDTSEDEDTASHGRRR